VSLLSGKKILVTAGPTHEPIDPVRFIGNHSSGKMGFTLCEELIAKGFRIPATTKPKQKEVEAWAVANGISLKRNSQKMVEGWEGKPKGLLQIL